MHLPELCELWDKFLQDTGSNVPNKAQMPAALDAWRVWGQHAGVSMQQQELCLGPERSVRVFIGNATLACTRVEKSKFARDSVVLTKSNGKYWAGRVNAFVSHAPPGWEDCHPFEKANVAEVNWYADAVPTAGISIGLSVCLGCTVFKRDFKYVRTGNLWPIERLTPCKLAAVPHCSHPDNLVVPEPFCLLRASVYQLREVS